MVSFALRTLVFHKHQSPSCIYSETETYESTHLDHWSKPRFALIQPIVFYPTVISILLLGPLSIIALWRLKKQVLAFEEKEQGERKFWNVRIGNPDSVDNHSMIYAR